jgi:hypothetical protein
VNIEAMTATATSAATATWTFDGRRAALACGPLSGVVDVTAPRGGLAALKYNGAALSGALLAVDIDGEASDAYVRGDDLVVTYRETPDRPFSVQLYWSAKAGECGELIIDATVSIQTRAWEAYPRVTVTSTLADAEIGPGAEEGVALLRPPGADWTYAETALPEDFALVEPGTPAGGTNVWTFADQFMERGVIRRRRVRGAFVPRDADLATAQRLAVSLRADEPPLTA